MANFDFDNGDFTQDVATELPPAWMAGDVGGAGPGSFYANNPTQGFFGGFLGGLGGGGGTGGGNLQGLMQLLGLGLGTGGTIASLLGGGPRQTQTPRMSGSQIDALNAYRGAIGSQIPQQQQMFNQGVGMLNNLQAGQIPQGLTNTVRAAYDPYLQNLGTNAIEASQRAGFALPQDAMTGGPGLRIMGQGLAQLPGQMAGTTLNTIFPLISALMGQGQQGVGNLGQAFNAFPTGNVQRQQPSMGQRFQGAAPWLAGIGNIANPPQDTTNQLLTAILRGQQQPQGGIPVAGQQQPFDTSIPSYQLT